jgi:peptidoglycan hydrolase-like protein with peptidoglycan-binding domain
MQDQSNVRSARALTLWLAALIALLAPASAASAQTTAGPGTAAGLSPRLLADASWHGRPIQRPWPTRRVAVRDDAADAASLSRGTGFVEPGGSDRVRRLQRRLTKLGYRPGRIDGLFGPRTQAAVIAFQRKHGLQQTGVAGSVTMRILRRRVVGHPAVEPAGSASPARSEPTRVAAPATSRTAAPETGGTGVDATTLSLALGITALAGLIVLAVLLALERRERRSIAQLNPAPSEPLAPSASSDRAIGYAAGRERGLRRQAMEIAATCHRRHLELVEVVSDAVDERTHARDRPGLDRVLRRVRDGDASTVVVATLDRLGASDEEIRGVLWTVARSRGSVIALDGAEQEEAARRGPELVDLGGGSWRRIRRA